MQARCRPWSCRSVETSGSDEPGSANRRLGDSRELCMRSVSKSRMALSSDAQVFGTVFPLLHRRPASQPVPGSRCRASGVSKARRRCTDGVSVTDGGVGECWLSLFSQAAPSNGAAPSVTSPRPLQSLSRFRQASLPHRKLAEPIVEDHGVSVADFVAWPMMLPALGPPGTPKTFGGGGISPRTSSHASTRSPSPRRGHLAGSCDQSSSIDGQEGLCAIWQWRSLDKRGGWNDYSPRATVQLERAFWSGCGSCRFMDIERVMYEVDILDFVQLKPARARVRRVISGRQP